MLKKGLNCLFPRKWIDCSNWYLFFSDTVLWRASDPLGRHFKPLALRSCACVWQKWTGTLSPYPIFLPFKQIAQLRYAIGVTEGPEACQCTVFLENHWLIRCILCLSYMLFSLLTYALFVNIGVSFSHRQESFTLIAFVKLVWQCHWTLDVKAWKKVA